MESMEIRKRRSVNNNNSQTKKENKWKSENLIQFSQTTAIDTTANNQKSEWIIEDASSDTNQEEEEKKEEKKEFDYEYDDDDDDDSQTKALITGSSGLLCSPSMALQVHRKLVTPGASLFQIFFTLLQRTLSSWLPGGGIPSSAAAVLDDETKSLLVKFKDFTCQPFDKDNPAHEELLEYLWNQCYPEESQNYERISKKWGKIGFQGKDPATDFRGPGIFGLQNLLYLANHYPWKFQQMGQFSSSQKDGMESYPFAITGMNITNMLFEILGWGMKPLQGSIEISAKYKLAQILLKDLQKLKSKDEKYDDEEEEEVEEEEIVKKNGKK